MAVGGFDVIIKIRKGHNSKWFAAVHMSGEKNLSFIQCLLVVVINLLLIDLLFCLKTFLRNCMFTKLYCVLVLN